MTALYVLIGLNYFFLLMGAVAALLLTASFSRKQRIQYPALRLLDGRQLSLTIAAILFFALGYVVYGLKEAVLLRRSFEIVPGPGTSQTVQATGTSIDLELTERAAHQANEARESFNTGQGHFKAGRYREAADDYQRSVDALPTLSAVLNHALSLRYLPDYRAAERALRIGSRLASEQHRERFEAHFSLYLSSVLIGQAKYSEADIVVTKALKIYERLDDDFGKANSHLNMGIIAQSRGAFATANAEWKKAFGDFQRADNNLGQANAIHNLGGLCLLRMQFAAAAVAFDRAIKLYQVIDNRTGVARASNGLALVFINQGRLTEALTLCRHSFDIAVTDKEMRSRALSLIGIVRDEQGKFEESKQAGLAALQLARDIGASDEEAFAEIELSSAFSDLGRARDAYDHAMRAIDIYTQGNDLPSLSIAFCNVGINYFYGNQLSNAADAFHKALAIADPNGFLFAQSIASAGLGMTEAALGHRERALQLLIPAHRSFLRAGVNIEFSRRVERSIARLLSKGTDSRK
ncbi:MAG TPA: tetratricopeptide repeat protein [Thermoanaerobaculia bacterium]|jgi:tetratricopeptide (TPR) repeat protein|nr:tetratricopeptide repeat protein [Thermoanaerobaculia bacterium]